MQSHFPRYSSLLHPVSPARPRLPRDAVATPAWWGIPLVYLVALALAQIVASVSDAPFGLISQAFILFLLIVHGLAIRDTDFRAFLHSLALVPLIGITALTLPMSGLSALAAVLAGALPVLGAVFLAARALDLGWNDLRLTVRWCDLLLATLAIPVGLGLGAIELIALGSRPAAPSITVATLVAALLPSLLVGLEQEVAFRGFMLTAAERLFGRLPAAIYVALLFAVIHLTYPAATAPLLALGLGAILAGLTFWTRSIATAVALNASLALSLTLIAPALLGS